ncbi:MAG: hypothetical protein H7Z75_17270, partial [Ferruginibacter sp.]|nr:hypothetical protein [Cytophagales bacterium]
AAGVDPLANFTLRDGQRVTIGYRELKEQVSVCMVGKIVEITCIEEVPSMATNP